MSEEHTDVDSFERAERILNPELWKAFNKKEEEEEEVIEEEPSKERKLF